MLEGIKEVVEEVGGVTLTDHRVGKGHFHVDDPHDMRALLLASLQGAAPHSSPVGLINQL